MRGNKILGFYNSIKKYYYYLRKSKARNRIVNDKKVIIDIPYPYIYHRYFYLLVKYFAIAGYTIYFPRFDFRYFRTKIWYRRINPVQHYFNLILEEGLFMFNSGFKATDDILRLTEKNLSADYFSPLLIGPKDTTENKYLFPMSMHPYIMHNDYWDFNYSDTTSRKNTIFTYGNLISDNYNALDQTPFKMQNRKDSINYITKEAQINLTTSYTKLMDFLNSNEIKDYLFFNGSDERIPFKDVRNILRKFNYFFAPPGVVMPLCHNIVEAMSVGTIPIIAKEYAQLMSPPLVDMQNSIIYKDLNELMEKFNLALKLDLSQIKNLHDGVVQYYKEFLHPISVINYIEHNKPEKIYLVTEHLSVKLLKDNINIIDQSL